MKTAIFSIGVFLISLFLGSCQPSETSCSVVDTGKTLDYKIGDKLLFSYNYTTVYPAPGVDSVYKRSGFIHPLKTLGGEVMTNCSPADHYHHFGLWYAWTKTTFEGNEIDFWNLHKKQGTVRFRNFEHVSDNGFVATLDHVVYPDSPAEKVAMNERLKINIGTTSLPGYYIDYHTTIRLASPSPITMEAYRYGGICIRTREDWNDQTAEMLTSEGLSRDEADGSRARWCYYQGKAGNEKACILIVASPSNLNYPEPLRVCTELFMMIKVLYTPTEHAYFFQSMIQPQDNFRVFVCNNYDKAQGVAELASLAGMSLSVFKRRFAEHFNDSVYHWMMRQKALKVFTDIRDGEDSTKALMNKYGFRHYTQFSRFCKNYLQPDRGCGACHWDNL